MLGAAADGNVRQERTSTKEIARKESPSSLGTCGAASDGNGRQEQTPAKKTATEVGLAQVHFRVHFVKAIVLSEKADRKVGTHAEKRV